MKRIYTLRDVLALVDPLCSAEGFRAPSEITLKMWSAKGAFDHASSMDEAAKIVLKRVRKEAKRYSLRQADSEKVKPPKPAPAHSVKQDRDHDELRGMTDQLHELIPLLQGLVSMRDRGTDQAVLLAAVNQLDGVRKHLLTSHDAQMRSERRATGGGGDLVDVITLNKRLASLDTRLAGIEAQLASLLIKRQV